MLRCELRHGDYADVLSDESWDTAIMDAPYSARTHGGYDAMANDLDRNALGYAFWTPDDVARCVEFAVPRTRDWFVTITDHTLGRSWHDRLAEAGLYTFAPVPWINPLANVRMSGDGPASAACWIVAARVREKRMLAWGSLPGWYRFNGVRGAAVVGAKPLRLMRALVCDYSKPGATVADLTAGGASTLIAARVEGRAAIGAEAVESTYQLAASALSGTYVMNPAQTTLWGVE